MEDQQAAIEPSQQFENIDFNSSPDDNNKESSNNEDQEQVKYFNFPSHSLSPNPWTETNWNFVGS